MELALKLDIKGCARCHGDGHQGLELHAFVHPVEADDGSEPYTYWATCPITGDPILVRWFTP